MEKSILDELSKKVQHRIETESLTPHQQDSLRWVIDECRKMKEEEADMILEIKQDSYNKGYRFAYDEQEFG